MAHVTEIRRFGAKAWHDIGYQRDFAMDRSIEPANFGLGTITTIGSRLCKRHQSSSRLWQYLVWQVALKVTLSAASLARQAVLWPQKFWEQIQPAQRLLGPQLAFCATTQGSTAAVNVDYLALAGVNTHSSRLWGSPQGRLLRFGGALGHV